MAASRSEGELFVVDDDPEARDFLALTLTGEGYRVTSFAEGDSFLAAARLRVPACVLLDVHMPRRSGFDILGELTARRYDAPVVIISGQAEIPVAVDAIKRGAFDFIGKPFARETVIAHVCQAILDWNRPAPAADLRLAAFPGSHLLTPREREVLGEIANGSSNKQAGRNLGISPRTIEVHRARIMEKLCARNAADLMRVVLAGGGGPH